MATSKVEVVVLGLLAEEPLYGYDLLERFRTRSMGFWVEIGKASVYQALRRLEREGLISGRAQDGPEGPDRRVYRISKAGRDRLRGGLSERIASLEPYETDGGLALGFAHLLSASDARRAVDARETAVRDLLDAIKTERVRVSADKGPGRVVSTAMLQRQESLAKAELAWIKGFRADLGRIRR
ncbi:MAG: PadR family transcriptional regulator [Actinomycetota bacterium]